MTSRSLRRTHEDALKSNFYFILHLLIEIAQHEKFEEKHSLLNEYLLTIYLMLRVVNIRNYLA